MAIANGRNGFSGKPGRTLTQFLCWTLTYSLLIPPANSQNLPPIAARPAPADAAETIGTPATSGSSMVPPLAISINSANLTRNERITKAEELYEAGRKKYLAGDIDEARAYFDAALDLILNTNNEGTDRAQFDKRFEELVQGIYRLDVDGMGAGRNTEPGYDKAPIDDILSLTFPVDPKLKNQVRESITDVNSQLPLEATDAVVSFINYFNSERGRRTLIAGLRRSGKYREMISRILKEENMPQEFIFLAQAESGFLPRAVSWAAAGGMWQFIRDTGRQYGLRYDSYIDERFDPELATRAAARHLRDLYNKFGDWYLAIAAYNCGAGNVEKAVERTGHADVWELRSRGNLPLETSNYVPIILAMTIMAKNPKLYGLEEVVPEEPLEYDSVTLTDAVSVQLVADLTGNTATGIKELNPALLRDVAPAGYTLRLPKNTLTSFMTGVELIPEGKRTIWRAHRMEAGEDASTIAARYRVSTEALEEVNPGLRELALGEGKAGRMVVVPAAPAPVRPAYATVKKYKYVKGKRVAYYARVATRPAGPAAGGTQLHSRVAAKAGSKAATTRRGASKAVATSKAPAKGKAPVARVKGKSTQVAKASPKKGPRG